MKLKDLLSEAKSPFYQAGHEAGPNGTGKLNFSSQEGKYIQTKMDELYALVNDKSLIDFAKGYVDSVSARQYSYDGLPTVAKVLLSIKKSR